MNSLKMRQWENQYMMKNMLALTFVMCLKKMENEIQYMMNMVPMTFMKPLKRRTMMNQYMTKNIFLKVKKSLQTTSAKEEPWLGHDIFQTHFTSQDMTCNDIIDNKICENVAPNYLTEKLKSQPIEHQDAYKLQWLNNDNEIKLSQHSTVSFSIDNNYKERL